MWPPSWEVCNQSEHQPHCVTSPLVGRNLVPVPEVRNSRAHHGPSTVGHPTTPSSATHAACVSFVLVRTATRKVFVAHENTWWNKTIQLDGELLDLTRHLAALAFGCDVFFLQPIIFVASFMPSCFPACGHGVYGGELRECHHGSLTKVSACFVSCSPNPPMLATARTVCLGGVVSKCHIRFSNPKRAWYFSAVNASPCCRTVPSNLRLMDFFTLRKLFSHHATPCRRGGRTNLYSAGTGFR